LEKRERDDTGVDRGGGAGGVHGVAGESGGAGVPFRPCPSTGSFSHPPHPSLCFFSPQDHSTPSHPFLLGFSIFFSLPLSQFCKFHIFSVNTGFMFLTTSLFINFTACL